MQAIETRYIGPTDTRGSRVSATAEAGRVVLSWDNSLDSEANHDAAALALCKKFDWRGELASGSLKGAPGNVYVFCHTARSDHSGDHVPPRIVGPFR